MQRLKKESGRGKELNQICLLENYAETTKYTCGHRLQLKVWFLDATKGAS